MLVRSVICTSWNRPAHFRPKPHHTLHTMSTPSSPLIHLYFSSTSFKHRRCSLVVPRCWRVLVRCSVPVVVVPLPPGWCGWHPGFPSGMFHLFPSLLVRPSSVGFLPHLLLAVIGRRCCQVKVVALADSTCSPVAVAMLCFFFGSVFILILIHPY
ncbi:hypothetical protein GQ42DRAFT_49000 [Ramicandelaber brevisporus]|nr:hypothetical protein GQ42DRAFT_49000 [Ramicandelaber brevisporus]